MENPKNIKLQQKTSMGKRDHETKQLMGKYPPENNKPGLDPSINFYKVDVAINEILSIRWRYYGPEGDILDYWGTLIFCLLYYFILFIVLEEYIYVRN